jgi:hypothetical protein
VDPIGRIMMGGLGLFVAWTLVRAWRSGVIYSRGFSFNVNNRPVLYTLGFVIHIGIVVICAAFAAGFSPNEVHQFVLWPLNTAH